MTLYNECSNIADPTSPDYECLAQLNRVLCMA